MKEHQQPHWANDNKPKVRLMRAVPTGVNDEVGIRKHIYEEAKRLGLPKPKGKLEKIPLNQLFRGAE